MPKEIMVLTESKISNQNIEKEAKETRDGKEGDNSSSMKLFSCEELEKSIGLQLTDTMQKSTEELKQVDPAIMSCSTSTKMTRYNKQELINLKYSKASSIKPECLFRKDIVKLAIACDAENDENFGVQNPPRPFIPLNEWNPEFVAFINNYRKASGFEPANIPLNHPYFMQPQQYLSQQQAAFLEKISPYQRTNFFDTISNNSSMRSAPKMGVSSLNGRASGCQEYSTNRKAFSCANERYQGGGFIPNKSFDNIDDRPREVVKEMKQGEGENEPTPEWYTAPATRDEVIDLRGFEEGDGENHQPQVKPAPTIEKGYGTPSLAYRRSGYNQNRNNNNTRYGYNGNNSYNNGNGYYNNAQNNNQRFRNPLHFQKSQNVPPTNNWQNPANPFFDMWQRARFAPGQPTNFQNLMHQPQPPLMPQMPPLDDYEKTMRARNYLASLVLKSQNMQVPVPPQMQPPLPIHQFFQQWPNQAQGTTITPEGQVRNVPTHEQMQVLTSEIMRNAILRKNQMQQENAD